MLRATTLAALFLATVGLAGCPAVRPPVAPSMHPAPPAGPLPPVAGTVRYRVVSGESLVVVLAFRGGALASFGHNHVIASRALTGFIDVAEPARASTVELHLPVASFTVDDPALRRGRGDDFAAPVPVAAREGTRQNMLGTELLDATEFPEIVVRSTSIAGGPHDFSARLDVNVRGLHHALEVPVTVERAGPDQLQVRARFPVAQTALGLTPFGIMLGALQVEDTLAIEVDLAARREPGAGGVEPSGPAS